MADLFPYLRLEGKTPEEKIKELERYLIQFKETLEFELASLTDSIKEYPELEAKVVEIIRRYQDNNGIR